MDGSEKRRATRKRVLLEGRVVFNNRFSLVECTVRDISATGAKITFPHPTSLPGEVEFEIPKSRESFRARVMWSDGKTHGLMFVDNVGNAIAPPTQEATQEIAPASEVAPPTQEVAPPSEVTTPREIQAVIMKARHEIARLAGVSPEAVQLKLEIHY